MRMSVDPARAELASVLLEAKAILTHPEDDSPAVPEEDVQLVLELDGLLAALQGSELPRRFDIEILFAPTGPIQDASLRDGWGDAFLALAERCDAAVARLYGA
jgi:hypothetical protein